MKETKTLKELLARLKKMKNIEWIAIILVFAIILSIYTSTLKKSKDADQKDQSIENEQGLHWVENAGSPESREEYKLKEILSSIKGARKVEVMITYYSGKEIITAMNTVESTTTTEEEDNSGGIRKINQKDVNAEPSIFSDSEGSKPIILKEVGPEIKGVIVVAQGAEDIRVKLELMKAVQVALGVNPNQVEVFSMENTD
ncbi:MAG: stage III sporulation protein AG [Clostridiales bacterium]|nr:stage III sporulation protein AG [Clostridiales bacterium]